MVWMRPGVAMASANNIIALDSARVEAEAAAWIGRLDSEGANESDQVTFQAWCKLSSLHLKTVQELAILWLAMGSFAEPSSSTSLAVSSSTCVKTQVPVGG